LGVEDYNARHEIEGRFVCPIAHRTKRWRRTRPSASTPTTVLDGTGKTLKNATIVVQGSKITSIENGRARPTPRNRHIRN